MDKIVNLTPTFMFIFSFVTGRASIHLCRVPAPTLKQVKNVFLGGEKFIYGSNKGLERKIIEGLLNTVINI